MRDIKLFLLFSDHTTEQQGISFDLVMPSQALNEWLQELSARCRKSKDVPYA